MFSFGTPDKERHGNENLASVGKSVRFGLSPSDFAGSPIEEEKVAKSKIHKKKQEKFIPKGPNTRLIDVKNSTWKTKNELSMNARHLDGKMLYTLGPNEAYIVDKTFDRDMNILELGYLSHKGEEVLQKKAQKEFTVTMETGYNNEHGESRSRVTPSMRNSLHEAMHEEHKIVINSPKKYPREAQQF